MALNVEPSHRARVASVISDAEARRALERADGTSYHVIVAIAQSRNIAEAELLARGRRLAADAAAMTMVQSALGRPFSEVLHETEAAGGTDDDLLALGYRLLHDLPLLAQCRATRISLPRRAPNPSEHAGY